MNYEKTITLASGRILAVTIAREHDGSTIIETGEDLTQEEADELLDLINLD